MWQTDIVKGQWLCTRTLHLLCKHNIALILYLCFCIMHLFVWRCTIKSCLIVLLVTYEYNEASLDKTPKVKLHLSLCLPVSSSRKSRQEGGCVIKHKRPVQRRMTCPSPQEISRALQSPPAHPSFRAASLDELILRCLHCFGWCATHLSLSLHLFVLLCHCLP